MPQGVVNVISTATDTLIESLAAVGRVTLAATNSFVAVGGPELLLLKPSAAFVGLVSLAGSGSMAVTRNGEKAYVPVPGSNGVTVLNIHIGKTQNSDRKEEVPRTNPARCIEPDWERCARCRARSIGS